MRKNTNVAEALEAATDGLLDVAILATDDEALRDEAVAAFERFMEIAENLKGRAEIDSLIARTAAAVEHRQRETAR